MTELCSWRRDLFEGSERHTTNLMSSEIGLAPSFPHQLDLVEEFKGHGEAFLGKRWSGSVGMTGMLAIKNLRLMFVYPPVFGRGN